MIARVVFPARAARAARAGGLAGLALFGAACTSSPDEAGLECPSGATPFRLTSATGTEDWCKLDDGVSHGAYEKRDDSGALLVVGAFDQGLATGDWHRFDEATHAPLADEGYARALPHGRWVTWDANGEPAFEHTWAYGTPCGTWREFQAGVEVSHADYSACDQVEAPNPPPPGESAGPPLAVVGDFGWDGTACEGDRALVSAPADDPTARYCVQAGSQILDGPFGRWDAGGEGGAKTAGGEYDDGAPAGTWRGWYPGGTLSEEGAREASGRVGPWRFWRADRSLEHEGAFSGDRRTGAWRSYWPHGTRMAEGRYVEGKKDGGWKTYFPSGIPDGTPTYRQGALEGAYTKNHPSGVHAETGAYQDDERAGRWTTWHVNGVEASRGEYTLGLKSGEWKLWDRDGLPEAEGRFAAGRQSGTWSLWRWQSDERVKSTGAVVDGLAHGRWVATHDPGGEPAGEVTYHRGRREGPSNAIWKNGNTLSEGRYLAGQPQGPWKFYYEDGQLFVDCGFVRGQLQGEYRDYHPDGEPRSEGVYSEGAKVGLWTYWDKSGQMHTEGTAE